MLAIQKPQTLGAVLIEQGLLRPEQLNQALAEMRGRLSDPRFPRFVQAVEIFTNETDVQINVIETERAVARRFYEWCESKQAIEYATSFGTFFSHCAFGLIACPFLVPVQRIQ